MFCFAAAAPPLCPQQSEAAPETQEAAQTASESANQTQARSPQAPPDVIAAVPNRPTFATTAESVQRGVFEIEYGLEAASRHQNINGLLKWGALRTLELRFNNNPVQREAGVAGTGDSGAGFKYKIISQSKTLPTFSILYTAAIPTAPASRGAGAVGHSIQLLASKDFGKHHLDVNEGVQFVGRHGASGFDRNYFTALSYSYPFTRRWGITGELAGFSRTNAAIPATMTVLESLTFSPSPRLVLDAGGYFAAYGKLPRFTFTAGVTYAIADLYHLSRSKNKK